MSDKLDDLEIMDEEEQTIALDEGEDEEESSGEDSVEFDDEGDEESLEPLRPPAYRPDSNIYTILIVLGFLAYAVAIGFVLEELKAYCDPNQFMWGAFKK